MSEITIAATVTLGSSSPEGSVPQRFPLTFTAEYTEKSDKIIHLVADTIDDTLAFDSVSAPKVLLLQCLEGTVTVKLTNSASTDPAATTLNEGDGWVLITSLIGQSLDSLLVSTPAAPTSGSRLHVLALE